jgi:hypothetical protein
VTGARAARPGIAPEPAIAVPGAAAVPSTAAVPSGRVMERGRSKAHRPLPSEARLAAVTRGLAAYDRGAWYLAHEELEPAWMGTDDLAERALLSGLIKVAAAYVHATRGNPLGVRTNLRGARERLATAAAAAPAQPIRAGGPRVTIAGGSVGPTGAADRIDLPALLSAVDDRLARVEALCDALPAATAGGDADGAAPPHDVAGPAGRFRGAPVAIPPIPLPRRAT